jgi:hypothetical protein
MHYKHNVVYIYISFSTISTTIFHLYSVYKIDNFFFVDLALKRRVVALSAKI